MYIDASFALCQLVTAWACLLPTLESPPYESGREKS